MPPGPNSYELPERMKRANVRPVPIRTPLLATLPFKLMLAGFGCFFPGLVCLYLVGLGEGQFRYLEVPMMLLLPLWLLCSLLSLLGALFGLVRGVGVALNVFVLAVLLVFVSLMGVLLR